MPQRQILLDILVSDLRSLSDEIKGADTANRMALKARADRVVCGMLNGLYGWNLENLNQGASYHPAIDLGDPQHGTAVHVDTSKKPTRSNIQRVVQGFAEHGVYSVYGELFIFTFITPALYDSYKIVLKDFKFSSDENIWTPEHILRQARDVPMGRLRDAVYAVRTELRSAAPFPLPLPPLPCESFVYGSRTGEVDRMSARLAQGQKLCLWGMAGIGKTQLAARFAWTSACEKDVRFLRYRSGEGMRATILDADFRGYRFEGEDTPDRETEYRARLDMLRTQYRDAVLIIDGFDCPGQTADALMKEQAFRDLEATGVTLLLTTRSRVKGAGLEVGPLAEEDLLKLMRSGGRAAACQDSQLLPVIRQAERHTLTVELLARTLERGGEQLTPEHIGSAMEEGLLHLLPLPGVAPDGDDAQPEGTVVTHLQRLLASFAADPQTEKVLFCAALVPRDGMEAQYFRSSLPRTLWNELHDLTSQSLLIQKRETLYTPAWVRLACLGQPEPLRRHSADFLETLWGSIPPAGFGSPLVSQLAACFSAAELAFYPNAAQYALRAARLWELAGDRPQAISHAQAAFVHGVLGEPMDQAAAASLHLFMGRLHHAAGQHEDALECRRRALEELKMEASTHESDLAAAYFELALSCTALGDHRMALECHMEAQNIRKRILSANHPDLALSVRLANEAFRRLSSG